MSILDVLETLAADKKKESSELKTEGVGLLKAAQGFIDGWPRQAIYTDTLRASQMYDTCPREFVFNYWQPKPVMVFDWKSQMMMGIGSHLHHFLQNCVLGPMGVLKGKWIGYTEEASGYHPDPVRIVDELSKQAKLSWEYREPTVYNAKYRISGHQDGFISLSKLQWVLEHKKEFTTNFALACNQLHSIDEGELVNLEIKSSGNYTWDKMVEPKDIADYYRMQACIYQAMTGIFKTLFLWVNRDSMQMKVLTYNYEKKWWDLAKRKARIVWEAVRDEILPETEMKCKLPTDKRAKACVFRKECFARKYDFKKYVQCGKECAEKEGRKLLDLTGVTFDV